MMRTASKASAGLHRPARPPRARGLAQAGKHRTRRAAAGSAATHPASRSRRWSACDRSGSARRHASPRSARPPARSRTAPHRRLRGTRCGSALPAAPAAMWWPAAGRSDSSGLSTWVVVRRGSSGGRPHWSNTPAGRNGVGRISTNPLSASDFPTARRRFCTGVRPRPAGACGSTDGMISRPSSRSTSSTRSAGCRRSGRQLGGVTVTRSPSTATSAPICVSLRRVVPAG